MNATVTEVGGADRRRRIIDKLRVDSGAPANLAGRDTRWTGGGEFDHLWSDELDATAKALLARGSPGWPTCARRASSMRTSSSRPRQRH
jgi:hypothetical protein